MGKGDISALVIERTFLLWHHKKWFSVNITLIFIRHTVDNEVAITRLIMRRNDHSKNQFGIFSDASHKAIQRIQKNPDQIIKLAQRAEQEGVDTLIGNLNRLFKTLPGSKADKQHIQDLINGIGAKDADAKFDRKETKHTPK